MRARASADRLGVSVNTVKTQVARLLAKTGTKILDELIAPLHARFLRSDPTAPEALVRPGD
jgi:DNA-binding CsgD family transcriptional regulator